MSEVLTQQQALERILSGAKIRNARIELLSWDVLRPLIEGAGTEPPAPADGAPAPDEAQAGVEVADSGPAAMPWIFENCTIEGMEFNGAALASSIDCYGCRFTGRVDFRSARLGGVLKFRSASFDAGVDFRGSVLAQNVHFNNARFGAFVDFSQACFKGRCIFSQAHLERGANFQKAVFERGASFNDILCDRRYEAQAAQFLQVASFSVARFRDVVDFSEVCFEAEVKFKGTHFAKRVRFQNVAFEADCVLRGSTMEDEAHFRGARFAALLDLRSVYASRPVDFGDARMLPEARLRLTDAAFGALLIGQDQLVGHLYSLEQREHASARKEFGLLKRCFHSVNEYEMEDWAYCMEKRMERLCSPHGVRRFFNWLALDVCCGYGTRPLNVFMSAMAILFCFAGVYRAFGSQFVGGGISWAAAIQVSFRIITNAEVNSAEPHPESWLNTVMMIESFLGLFVMMILVVTFSRKVIR